MLGPGSLDHFPPHRLGEFHPQGLDSLDLCERCEAVELWFDPEPNAQLMLVQLLDCLSSRENIVSKLTLFQADVDIAEQRPETISEWKPSGVKIRTEHLEAASMAWQAYRQPTPQHWFDLLGKDISVAAAASADRAGIARRTSDARNRARRHGNADARTDRGG